MQECIDWFNPVATTINNEISGMWCIDNYVTDDKETKVFATAPRFMFESPEDRAIAISALTAHKLVYPTVGSYEPSWED